MSKDSILLVDDEPNVIAAVKRGFIDEPVEVFTAGGANEAMEVLKSHPIKVVISDEKMPGISGSDFLAMVKQDYPNVIRIMLTGHASIDAAMKAINKGEIYRFFTKPWDDMDIRFAVRAAIEKYDLEEQNSRLLKLVKQQALNLKLLEMQFPGITKLEHDDKGRIILEDMSEQDLEDIITRYEQDIDELNFTQS